MKVRIEEKWTMESRVGRMETSNRPNIQLQTKTRINAGAEMNLNLDPRAEWEMELRVSADQEHTLKT